MSCCKVCGKPFKQRCNAQKYCDECGDYYHDKLRDGDKERAGNPKQDIEILRFIRKNRQ